MRIRTTSPAGARGAPGPSPARSGYGALRPGIVLIRAIGANRDQGTGTGSDRSPNPGARRIGAGRGDARRWLVARSSGSARPDRSPGQGADGLGANEKGAVARSLFAANRGSAVRRADRPATRIRLIRIAVAAARPRERGQTDGQAERERTASQKQLGAGHPHHHALLSSVAMAGRAHPAARGGTADGDGRSAQGRGSIRDAALPGRTEARPTRRSGRADAAAHAEPRRAPLRDAATDPPRRRDRVGEATGR